MTWIHSKWFKSDHWIGNVAYLSFLSSLIVVFAQTPTIAQLSIIRAQILCARRGKDWDVTGSNFIPEIILRFEGQIQEKYLILKKLVIKLHFSICMLLNHYFNRLCKPVLLMKYYLHFQMI